MYKYDHSRIIKKTLGATQARATQAKATQATRFCDFVAVPPPLSASAVFASKIELDFQGVNLILRKLLFECAYEMSYKLELLSWVPAYEAAE